MGSGDESATGSVIFFPFSYNRARMRLPAFSHGVTSFLWALGLAVFIWLGGMSVGMSRATAVVVAAVAGCAIFLYVRLYGEDDPRRP
jgi:hypothetical protein